MSTTSVSTKLEQLQSNLQKAKRNAAHLRSNRITPPEKRPVYNYYKNSGRGVKHCKKKKADTSAKLKAQRKATLSAIGKILKPRDPSK